MQVPGSRPEGRSVIGQVGEAKVRARLMMRVRVRNIKAFCLNNLFSNKYTLESLCMW